MISIEALINGAIISLEQMRRTPGMFFTTRGKLLCHVSAILSLLNPIFDTRDFWVKHLHTDGPLYRDYLLPLTTEWAKTVIDDSIDNVKLVKFSCMA